MEFNVNLTGLAPDIGAIQTAIRNADAAAVFDGEATNPTLRVAAAVNLPELVYLIREAGCPVSIDRVQQLPSVCCGGCGG